MSLSSSADGVSHLVPAIGECLLEHLSCADVRHLAVASGCWREAVAESPSWCTVRSLLPAAAYRFAAPRGQTPGQFLALVACGPVSADERPEPLQGYVSPAWAWRLYLDKQDVSPQRSGLRSSARSIVLQGNECGGLGGGLLLLSWSALARQAQWIRWAAGPRDFAHMAYPERWVRSCTLSSCLCLRGEVDRGPEEMQVQVDALCTTTDGALVAFSHHMLLGMEAGAAMVTHVGAAVVGRSLEAIEDWCRARPFDVPVQLTSFAFQEQFFVGPHFQGRSCDEWAALHGGDRLVKELDMRLAAV